MPCFRRWSKETFVRRERNKLRTVQLASKQIVSLPSPASGMLPTVHLVNPSDFSFGIAVITPRWLYVLAAATPAAFGDPELCDETVEPLNPQRINRDDIIGIGIHTGNALRGYLLGRLARERGAWVIFGGVHTTPYPDEAFQLGGAHAVVRGDGDVAWGNALNDCVAGKLQRQYEGGRIEAAQFKAARWDLLPAKSYMWASVQTV